MLTNLTEWISNNRELIGTNVAEWVSQTVPLVISFARGANDVAQALGGWQNVLLGIMGINLLSWVGRTIAALTPLIRLLALIPGSGVTAAALAAAGLGYLGYQAARETGTRTAAAGEVGLRPASLPGSVDEFGNVMLYQDASGRTYTPEEAPRLTQRRTFPGEGGMPAPGGGAPAAPGTPPSTGPVTPDRPFTGSQQEYFESTYRRLLGAAQARGLENPEVVARLGAAQSSVETGYGRHSVGNNMYGIKAGGGVGGTGEAVGTDEVVNGQRVRTSARFATFANQDEAAGGYIDFLLRNSRYRDVLRARTDQEAVAAIGRSGYATDPTYANTIASVQRRGQAIGVAQAAPTGAPAQVQAPAPAGGPVAQVQTPAAPRASGAVAQVGNGSGASAARQETTVRGSADVRISLENFPRNTRTAATTRGDLFTGAPRIEQAMPLGLG